jgi:aminoglycoside phosphotransferase (APT) family kinase protein
LLGGELLGKELLGEELLVRLPRLAGDGGSISKESRWTAVIGNHLPVAVPEIVGTGEPDFGYSEQWSIVRWQQGDHPTACFPEDAATTERLQLAAELADVLIAFRGIDINPEAQSDKMLRRHYRGRSLADHDGYFRQSIEACRSIEGLDLDLDAALSLWERSIELPGATGNRDQRRFWFHGDIVAENLLLEDGRLSGLLDFGGLGIGDPTVDLHGAWELFDAPARDVFRQRLEVDDATWLRGRAWALAIALMTFPYYWNTMPGRINDRMAMARNVLADPE